MAHTVIDTANVLELATPAVRKIAGKGNATYTFRARHDAGHVIKHRRALKHELADHLGDVPVTDAQAHADALQVVRPTPAYTPRRHPDTVAPIGAWVRVTRDVEARPLDHGASVAAGEMGQVWSHGPIPCTVWVAMGGTRYVVADARHLEVVGGAESTADALWEDAPATEPVDVTADAVALAERAEATGRDGVAFVRNAMGEAAADAVTAHRVAQLPTVHAAPIGPKRAIVGPYAAPIGPIADDGARVLRRRAGSERVTVTGPSSADGWTSVAWPDGSSGQALASRLEPAERVVTTTVCAECGTDVDATGVDASGDTACARGTAGEHLPACDGPAELPVGSTASWRGIDASLTVEAHTVVHGVAATRVRGTTGSTSWTRTDSLTSVAHAAWTFHDAMHAARRTHLRNRARLQAWRTACAMV